MLPSVARISDYSKVVVMFAFIACCGKKRSRDQTSNQENESARTVPNTFVAQRKYFFDNRNVVFPIVCSVC